MLKASGAANTAALVKRILEGDPNAETELFERYRRGVHAVIRHNDGYASVDDLSQDTFLIALEKIRKGELREPEKLREFICGIAKNLARRYAEKSRSRTEMGLECAEVIADPAPGPYAQLLQKEEIETVRQVIEQLPQDRDREALRRFYCDKEDKERICADLGLTVARFNKVLSRARKRFLERYRK